MKIAIIGAGAIGSVVAGYLTKSGVDCILIGREDQVAAINKNGLTIRGVRGTENIKIKVGVRLPDFYDLVIFTTKTQDLEEAYSHNNSYLDDCFVLSSQNGVQADNILGFHFEKEKMLSSIVMFGATYTNPGEVTFNFEGDWIIGKPYTPVGPQVHEFAALLGKALPTVVSTNIMGMKYLKLFVNFNNCIPAVLGKSMQETFADMDFCRLSILLLKEGVDIVNKVGIELVSLPQFPKERIVGLVNMPLDQAAGIINKTLTTLSKEPLYGSILQSIMRGRTSEIDFINGEAVHLATQIRMEAPFNRRIVEMVHEVEQTGQYFTTEKVKDNFGLASLKKV